MGKISLKNPKVAIDDDFGLMLNCSIRYALGRQTYMPSAVIAYVTPLLPYLDDRFLETAERDLSGRGVYYGDEIVDKPAWIGFLRDVRLEIESRKKAQN